MQEPTRLTLDDEDQIDRYLSDLLKVPENRSMAHVLLSADRPKNTSLKAYYLQKAESLLSK